MNWKSGNLTEWMARLGYGARGIVYCLVGGLAVLAATGSGGQIGGSGSALQTLLGQPFGKVLLGLIALGLLCFALWRVIEPLTDADRLGSSGKGLLIRGGHLLSSLAYAGIALTSLNLAIGRSGGHGDDQSARDWTAWLLGKPFGQWLVALVGIAVIGIGVAFFWKSWSGKVTNDLMLEEHARRWVIPLGRVGYAARGIVFVLIGGFLVLAAVYSNSSEAKGLGGALQSLQAQPYGWILLAITAAGLLAFGIFALVQARYRHIEGPRLDDIKEAATQGLS
ncbi:DUF1206 domain-containing protein [Microvirga sp. 2TAF3]|uniref:DUF1206 domain-containing protein n=1 Tax=Microvirga sp. 2TAF3 TaxID=3233014 RepID=UPI003F975A03